MFADIEIRERVVLGVVRSGNQFVFMQRRDGTWTFPGGKMKAGENFNTALVREVKEETGLNIVVDFNVGSRILEDRGVQVWYKICHPAGGALTLAEPDKFRAAQWMGAREILGLAGDNIYPAVRNYLVSYVERPAQASGLQAFNL